MSILLNVLNVANNGTDTVIKLDSLLSGLIGSLIGVVGSSIVSLVLLKKEKRYFLELEVLTDKMLNPLMVIYKFLKEREKEYHRGMGKTMIAIIPEEIYDKITKIYHDNFVWTYAINDKLSKILKNIFEYATQANEKLLLSEFGKLEEYIKKTMKKYK